MKKRGADSTAAKKRRVPKAKPEKKNPWLIDARDVKSSKVLIEAIVAVVDDPKNWGRKGMASEGMVYSTLPNIAETAVKLSSACCHFCGKSRGTMMWLESQDALQKYLKFHPEYQLCECLTQYRKRNHDHIRDWNTPAGKADILKRAETGDPAFFDKLVYQFVCKTCNSGPHVITVRQMFGRLRKGTYERLKKCDACFRAQAAKTRSLRGGTPAPVEPLKVPLEQVASPQGGHGAKFKKNKHKRSPGPSENSLPILTKLEEAKEAPTPG